MRLRLGRDLDRHNLQSVLDFEDFVYNRTNGLPANIFKVLGDAATTYVRTIDNITIECQIFQSYFQMMMLSIFRGCVYM